MDDVQSSPKQSGDEDEAEIGSPQTGEGIDIEVNNSTNEYQEDEGWLDAELSMMSLHDVNNIDEQLSDSSEQLDLDPAIEEHVVDVNVEELLNANWDRRYTACVDDDNSEDEGESDDEEDILWPWDDVNDVDDDDDDMLNWDFGEDFEKEAAELGEFVLGNFIPFVDFLGFRGCNQSIRHCSFASLCTEGRISYDR